MEEVSPMRKRARPIVGLLGVLVIVAACTGTAATQAPPEATQPPAATPAPASEAPASAPAASEPAASADTGSTFTLGDASSDQDLCTNPPKADGVTLGVASYGGAYQLAQRDNWFTPYAALTGVTFAESEESANATIQAQVESGQVTWDVVDVGNDFGLDANANLLEELDYSKIPGKEVIPGFASKYRVADITYGVVLAYRTDMVGGSPPQGWADFFDLAKYPGKRGIYDYSAGGVYEIALMADGVAPKDLYPLDLARAEAKLDTIKDSIVWWPSGAKSQELIGSGEVSMALMWNGRAWSAKNVDMKPVEIQWNQQLLTADFWVVPKGTPNKDAAMNFIAWTICKQNNAGPSNSIPYGPTNTLAQPAADKVADLAASNLNDTTAFFDDEWVVANAKMLDESFNAWKTK
jgi:putative spermidine/putrescine transport system substrate-binding protein